VTRRSWRRSSGSHASSGDQIAKPGFEGAKCVCSPPPRDKANQAVVWEASSNGVLQVVSSDHSPTRFNDAKGKMLGGTHASFRHTPNGVPDIETWLPLLFSGGVSEGRLDLTRFGALTATEPAPISTIRILRPWPMRSAYLGSAWRTRPGSKAR
jgi:dihydropyrimidinase